MRSARWPVALRRAAAAAVVALTLFGCRDEPASSVCDPGDQVVCICPAAREGTQTCRSDGTGFEPCECVRVSPDASGDDIDEQDVVDDVIEDADGSGDDAGADVQTDPDPDVVDDVEDVEPDVADDTEPDAPLDTEPDAPLDTEPDAPADIAEDPEPDPPVDTTPTPAALGEPCIQDTDCATGFCLGFELSGVETRVCSQTCCHEGFDCAPGFGCLQLGGGTYCLPANIFPLGTTFGGSVGQACSAGGQCQSDICDVERGCRGSCCTDADCTTTCRFLPAGSRYRTYCDSLGLIAGVDGEPCAGEFDCASGICLPDAASPFGGFCTSLCCRSAQCGVGRICGLIAGPTGGVARACVPDPGGSGFDGSACSTDADCLNDQCVEGFCRSVCCRDSDCSPLDQCAPVRTTFGVTTTFCVPRAETP